MPEEGRDKQAIVAATADRVKIEPWYISKCASVRLNA